MRKKCRKEILRKKHAARPPQKKEILRKNLIFQKEVTLLLLPLSQEILKGMCQELWVHTHKKKNSKGRLEQVSRCWF